MIDDDDNVIDFTLADLLAIEDGLIPPSAYEDEVIEVESVDPFLPVPYKMKPTEKIIAVVDTETDPFEYGLHIKPFTLGFYDGNSYIDFWGDDCVDQFFAYLSCSKDEYIIYAHNGGKFDFFFFLKYLKEDQKPFIINGRLVRLFFGEQEFRDSFTIIPRALGAYKKDEVDYSTFTKDKREEHKQAILAYQKTDCIYTHELVMGFHNMFGDKLTVASAALGMLHSYTGYQKMGIGEDERFRDYYYGGRNQCFETGVLKGNWKIYDRNSMYPAEMREALHPISTMPRLQTKIDKDTDFACILARNYGALPSRANDGGLDFTVERGTFWATIHEINAGLDTGTLIIDQVKHAWAFDRKVTFSEFVDRYYGLRLEAKASGDKIRDILYKLCLNSAYGKFALNPRKFRQYLMTVEDIPSPLATATNLDGWSLDTQSGPIMIWSRPSPRKGGFHNVATAASITGAARANLLVNLSKAKRPIYCDTDSIICESFTGDLNETQLGGWKLEGLGDTAAIGGKKLYAVFNEGEVIKQASKGVRLTANEIVRVCNGEEIVYQNPVPSFNLDGTADFVSRRINRT